VNHIDRVPVVVAILGVAIAFVFGTVYTVSNVSGPQTFHIENYVTLLDQPLSDSGEYFQLAVTCDKNFLLHTLIATVYDPDSNVNISYDRALLMGGGFGFNQAPHTWHIDVVNTYHPGNMDNKGYELLSDMKIDKPVGVAAGGSFHIGGFVNSSTDKSTINIGAFVTTSQDAVCTIIFNPF